MTSTDQAILAAAGRSAGICTRAELLESGVAASTISNRVRSGFLRRVCPGLYAVPSMTGPDTAFYRAARAHPGGCLSLVSAARLWGQPVIPAEPGEPLDLSLPRPLGTRPKLPGVIVHSVRRLNDEDLGHPRPGLPATSRARTIVDLAGTGLTDRRLVHVVQTEVVAERVTLAEIAASLGRASGRGGGRGVAGAGRLRALLDELDDGQPVPRSELERMAAGLLGPGFRRQFRPPWYDGVRGVVDFADPASRVVVEADGRKWHSSAQAMAEDRRRDRLAATNGWLVVRVTWSDVVERPGRTAGEVAAIVAGRADRAAA